MCFHNAWRGGERRGRETLFSGLAAAAVGLIRVGGGVERGKRKNIRVVGERGEHDQVTKATRRRKKRNVFLFFVRGGKNCSCRSILFFPSVSQSLRVCEVWR